MFLCGLKYLRGNRRINVFYVFVSHLHSSPFVQQFLHSFVDLILRRLSTSALDCFYIQMGVVFFLLHCLNSVGYLVIRRICVLFTYFDMCFFIFFLMHNQCMKKCCREASSVSLFLACICTCILALF